MPDGKTMEKSYNQGDMELIPLALGQKAKVRIVPDRGVDIGAGPGKHIEGEAEGGVVGVVIDARGRIYKTAVDATGKPFLEGSVPLPEDNEERVQTLKKWHKALNIYPDYNF
jgi:hypothetical protein